MIFQAFQGGNKQAIDLILLRPQAVGIELQQTPNDFLEFSEEGAQELPALVNFKIRNIHEYRVAQAGEIKGHEIFGAAQVKTTLFPINLLPPSRATTGEWRLQEDDTDGLKYVFVDTDNIVRGYVLTQEKCEQRMDMDKKVGETA